VAEEILRGARASHCDLSENRLSDAGAVALADALCAVAGRGRGAHTVQSLCCTHTDGGTGLCYSGEAWARCSGHAEDEPGTAVPGPALASLALSHNRIGPLGASALARAVASGAGLTKLCLDFNCLGALGGAAFAAAVSPPVAIDRWHGATAAGAAQPGGPGCPAGLCPRPSLDTSLWDTARGACGDTARGASLLGDTGRGASLLVLQLGGNALGCCGAAALAQALASSPALSQLRTLSLGQNCIRAAGAAALSRVLPLLPRMTDLDLAHNGLGGRGIAVLAGALPPGLFRLCLQGNGVDAAGVAALVEALEGSGGGDGELNIPDSAGSDGRAPANLMLRSLGAGFLDEAKAAVTKPTGPAPAGRPPPGIAGLHPSCTAGRAPTGISDGALSIAAAEALAARHPSAALRLAAALRRNERLAKAESTRRAAAAGSEGARPSPPTEIPSLPAATKRAPVLGAAPDEVAAGASQQTDLSTDPSAVEARAVGEAASRPHTAVEAAAACPASAASEAGAGSHAWLAPVAPVSAAAHPPPGVLPTMPCASCQPAPNASTAAPAPASVGAPPAPAPRRKAGTVGSRFMRRMAAEPVAPARGGGAAVGSASGEEGSTGEVDGDGGRSVLAARRPEMTATASATAREARRSLSTTQLPAMEIC